MLKDYLALNSPFVVSDARYQMLRKGINVTPMITNPELVFIKSLGFTFIRLRVEPADLMNGSALETETIAWVEDAISRAIAAGLAVMLDLHSYLSFSDVRHVGRRLEQVPAFAQIFIDFWSNLADALSGYSPEKLFFEILNEPVFEGSAASWQTIQGNVASAIRANAPDHTLILTANLYGKIDALIDLPILADQNVIYSFHCYDPMTLTHQGASWISAEFGAIANVPYPSTPENVFQAAANCTNSTAQGWITYYGSERWNFVKVKEQIDKAIYWAQTNHVRICCTEFSCAKVAPGHSYDSWEHDVRTALEASGIGWAFWEWSDGAFGLVHSSTGGVTLADRDIVKALNLNEKPFKIVSEA